MKKLIFLSTMLLAGTAAYAQQNDVTKRHNSTQNAIAISSLKKSTEYKKACDKAYLSEAMHRSLQAGETVVMKDIKHSLNREPSPERAITPQKEILKEMNIK